MVLGTEQVWLPAPESGDLKNLNSKFLELCWLGHRLVLCW